MKKLNAFPISDDNVFNSVDEYVTQESEIPIKINANVAKNCQNKIKLTCVHCFRNCSAENGTFLDSKIFWTFLGQRF